MTAGIKGLTVQGWGDTLKSLRFVLRTMVNYRKALRNKTVMPQFAFTKDSSGYREWFGRVGQE